MFVRTVPDTADLSPDTASLRECGLPITREARNV
jgi:hypothetical protein